MSKNKTSIDLLTFCDTNALSKNPDEFIYTIYNFFIQKFPELNFTVLGFNYSPETYKDLVKSDYSKKIIDELVISDKSKKFKKGNFIKLNNLFIFPLYDELDKISYLLIFENISVTSNNGIGLLCINVQMLFRVISINVKTMEESLKDNYANLISQINHDFNSMISLIGKENVKNKKLQHKLEYSEKMTRDILFYIRDVDIISSSVPVKKLIESIVENITIPENINFEYAIDENLDRISVDVELINKAIESILINAFRAVSSNNGDVVLSVSRKKNKSVFIEHDWVQIVVTDYGAGITEDFLPLVKNPFFTTFKPEGYCGFGLTNADKIIRAHDGCILIESIENKETKVKIFIPLSQNYE